MKNTYLSIEDFEVICSLLHNFFENFPDPAPDYRMSDFAKLDMIIHAPKQTFGSQDLYPTIFHKAACYLYFINKFHPFNNGNKRVSIVATYVYLRFNDHILYVDNETLYQFAKEIAQSKRHQDEDFKLVVDFLKKFTKEAQQ